MAVPHAQSKPKSHKPVAHRLSGKKSAGGRKSSGRAIRASGKPGRGKRGRYSAKATPSASWRNRQLAPTSDRYREIQDALASKGYLKSAPSGSWDVESQDALKRFQADRKLEQTGKLNSLSLIALGLGPTKAQAPVTPATQPQP